jgi:hypothetical protein
MYPINMVCFRNTNVNILQKSTKKNSYNTADVDHLHVPRKYGGKGLMQLQEAHTVKITKLVEYGNSKEDPLT